MQVCIWHSFSRVSRRALTVFCRLFGWVKDPATLSWLLIKANPANDARLPVLHSLLSAANITMGGVVSTEKAGSALALSANASLIAIGAPDANSGKMKMGYVTSTNIYSHHALRRDTIPPSATRTTH